MAHDRDEGGKTFMVMVLGAIAFALLIAAYLLYGPAFTERSAAPPDRSWSLVPAAGALRLAQNQTPPATETAPETTPAAPDAAQDSGADTDAPLPEQEEETPQDLQNQDQSPTTPSHSGDMGP
jgi:hypothetical protein